MSTNTIANETAPSPTDVNEAEAKPHQHNYGPFNNYVFDPAAQPPLEREIYTDFLAEGDLVTWLGREKHRKTNELMQFSICAATGRNYLHFRFAADRPLRVCFIDYESKERKLWERFTAIRNAMGLSEGERTLLD